MENMKTLSIDWQSSNQGNYLRSPGIRAEEGQVENDHERKETAAVPNARFFSHTATLDWLGTWRQISFNNF